MSTLISSAVGGKKAAAPKGAVRRRQPPPSGAPEKAAVPVTVTAPTAQSSVALPSPPPTQIQGSTVIRSSEDVLPTASRVSTRPTQTTPTPIPTPTTTTQQAAPEPSGEAVQLDSLNKTRPLASNKSLQLGTQTVPTATATSRKRKKQNLEIAEEPAAESPKKAKRSSARSNDKVQSTVQDEEITQLNAPPTQIARTRKQQPSVPAPQDELAATTSAPKTRSDKQAAGPRFQLTPSTTAKKRKPEATKDPSHSEPAQKAKRSSARGNDTAQEAVQQDETEEQTTTTAAPSKTTQKKGTKKQQSIAAPITTPVAAPTVKQAQGKVPAAKKGQATEKGLPPSEDLTSTKHADSTAAKLRKRFKQKATTVATTPTQESEGTGRTQQAQPAGQSTGGQKRRTHRKQAPQQLQSVESGEESEDDGSDPELHEIDPNTVTMWEVGGTRRYGKTSEREKKMAAIDWNEVKQKREEEVARIVAGEQPAQPAVTSTATGDDAVESTEGADGTAVTQPVVVDDDEPALTIRNGEIVENERNLVIDRRERVEKEIAENTEPIVEDTDLTTRMNRTTYLNSRKRDPKERLPMAKAKSDPWNEEETERFYEALRMFGTDFFIISQMFAPKTRRQIKMKFVREERLDPIRVDRALGVGSGGGAAYGGRKEMDLEHYAREVGTEVEEFTKFNSLEEAEAEIRESFAAQAAEAERLKNEQAEAQNNADNETEKRDADKQARKNAKGKQQGSRKKGEGQGQRGRKKATAGGDKAKGVDGAAEPKKKKGVGRPRKGAKAVAAANPTVSEVVAVADG